VQHDDDGRVASGVRGGKTAVRAARLRTMARSGWRCDGRGSQGDGGASKAGGRKRRARGGREADGASEAGCRDARRPVPTAALSHGVCAARGSTRQRRAAARERRGVRRLTGGARSSAISKLKITPKENSSKQIAKD
jgi:hypothetical protein